MNSLLLTVDFINDIVHPEGKFASAAQYVLENNTLQQAHQAIQFCRQQTIPIIHVKLGFSPNYLECPQNSPLFTKAKKLGALKLGEWGTEFHEVMDIKPQDNIIIKHRVSALYATPLASILTANQIDQVFIAGVSTNMAVETVARELHDRDYQVVIIEDACGAASKENHQAALNSLSRFSKIICVAEMA